MPITVLTVNTTYYYRVRATNGAGESSYSNEASATTYALPQPPAAPGSLSATAASSSQINLSWADNSNNETGFEIDRATASGGPYTQIAATGANVTIYADNGLAVSTIYFYRVRATNAAGDSPNSNEVSATTLGAPTGNLALNKPATASSTNSSYVPSRAVDGSTASSSYWRSANVSKTSPNTWLRVDLGSAFSLTRAVVKWRENYFAKQYRLQISNSGGSADSEWSTVYTNTAGAAGTQDVTFTSPFAARYFRIRIDRNNKDNTRIFELECYAGVAKLNAGEDGFGSAASPEDFELEQNYPNPFNPTTMIRFWLPVQSEITLKIYGVNGQLVKELASGMFAAGRHSFVWDATDKAGQRVASGVYVYVLKAGDFVAQRKLVVMK
jgi:hypothetical protein